MGAGQVLFEFFALVFFRLEPKKKEKSSPIEIRYETYPIFSASLLLTTSTNDPLILVWGAIIGKNCRFSARLKALGVGPKGEGEEGRGRFRTRFASC